MQSYFKDRSFPHNMPGVWGQHFYDPAHATGQPIIVGEMGGFLTGLNKQWQEAFVAFCVSKRIGLFYFCLNPSSVDTGGLVEDDWTTPVRVAHALMCPLVPAYVSHLTRLHLSTS